MKLLQVDTLDEARKKIEKATAYIAPKTVKVSLEKAFGMTLSEDMIGEESIPPFSKSTVDGYAVIAADTFGAGENIPAFLKSIGEVIMGKNVEEELSPGRCAYIPTGGMLPRGADAVVMVEHSELFGSGQVAIYDSVSSGRNVIKAGDDVKKGECFLSKGTILGAQEIGVLASMGIEAVPVFCPWKVTILSTGDELVEVNQPLQLGQIRDSNSYTLGAQCKKYGLEVVARHILPDDESSIRKAISEAKITSDLLIISGGSSQGKKDMTASLLDELNNPGVLTHGIAIKPGKPTILALDEESGTILVGLPGHPVAAMMIFELLIGWAWRKGTCSKEPIQFPATIDTNVPGGAGRILSLLIQLSPGEKGWIATPVFGNSGLMTTLTRAHGYTLIDGNREGVIAGETVKVTLL